VLRNGLAGGVLLLADGLVNRFEVATLDDADEQLHKLRVIEGAGALVEVSDDLFAG